MQQTARDPWQVLGIGRDTDAAGIRVAYLQQVKLNPPEHDPEKFEAIRDAYQCLSDPHQRSQEELLKVDFRRPLAELLQNDNQERRFVGPGPWLEVVKEQV